MLEQSHLTLFELDSSVYDRVSCYISREIRAGACIVAVQYDRVGHQHAIERGWAARQQSAKGGEERQQRSLPRNPRDIIDSGVDVREKLLTRRKPARRTLERLVEVAMGSEGEDVYCTVRELSR